MCLSGCGARTNLEQSVTAKLGLNDVSDRCWRQKRLVTSSNNEGRFVFLPHPYQHVIPFEFWQKVGKVNESRKEDRIGDFGSVTGLPGTPQNFHGYQLGGANHPMACRAGLL